MSRRDNTGHPLWHPELPVDLAGAPADVDYGPAGAPWRDEAPAPGELRRVWAMGHLRAAVGPWAILVAVCALAGVLVDEHGQGNHGWARRLGRRVPGCPLCP